ncbi:MAG: hypothetical protein U0802_13560 [Candidatus Binatia bacterium]
MSLAEAVRRWGAIGGGEPRHAALSGTRGLMAAVLEDGIRAYLDRDTLSRQEAEGWVGSRARSWPFAFETVCMALDLEPDAVRAALRRMRDRQISGRRALGRSRSNVYRRGRLG